MKRVPLTRGKVALVSDADYALVRRYSWQAMRARQKTIKWYARARLLGSGQPGQTIYMHRLIAGFPLFKMDHRNCNGLDNRRANLRLATNSQNAMNRRVMCSNRARAKGVHWDKRRGKWRAQIVAGGIYRNLGRYSTKVAAIRAYHIAAQKLHRDFARN